MKVTKWVDMGQEVAVEIGTDDIRCALSEAFANVTEPQFEEVPNRYDVTRAIDSMAKFLKAMTDEHIELLGEPSKKIVRDFLLITAERFKPRVDVGGVE